MGRQRPLVPAQDRRVRITEAAGPRTVMDDEWVAWYHDLIERALATVRQ